MSEQSSAVSGGNLGKRALRSLTLAVAIAALAFGVGGCASDGYVGESTYPNYTAYYGAYGYNGIPYAGYNGIYTRRNLIGHRRHLGGYGRHHFLGDHGGHRSVYPRSPGGTLRGGRGGNR